MPTYDYLCSKCGHKQEAFQKITDDPLKICDKCHEPSLVRKPGGGIGLTFSGDGFYSTMYGKGNEKKGEDANKCCPCGKTKELEKNNLND